MLEGIFILITHSPPRRAKTPEVPLGLLQSPRVVCGLTATLTVGHAWNWHLSRAKNWAILSGRYDHLPMHF